MCVCVYVCVCVGYIVREFFQNLPESKYLTNVCARARVYVCVDVCIFAFVYGLE